MLFLLEANLHWEESVRRANSKMLTVGTWARTRKIERSHICTKRGLLWDQFSELLALGFSQGVGDCRNKYILNLAAEPESRGFQP